MADDIYRNVRRWNSYEIFKKPVTQKHQTYLSPEKLHSTRDRIRNVERYYKSYRAAKKLNMRPLVIWLQVIVKLTPTVSAPQ